MPEQHWPDLLDRLALVSHVGGRETERLRQNPEVDPGIDEKAGGELVSLIDTETSARMKEKWSEVFPDKQQIDEEDKDDGTRAALNAALLASDEEVGITDPVDGTTDLLDSLGLPEHAPAGAYGNTVALLKKGIVLGAVMHQIPTRQLFCAAKGQGCWWFAGKAYDHFWETGELKGGRRFLIAETSLPKSPSRALMLAVPNSTKMTDADMDRWLQIRWRLWERRIQANDKAAGCAVGNTINVLFGRVAYANIGGGVAWDLAAPGLCVEEAGGWASTTDGKPLIWDRLKLPVLFARDAAIAKRLLEVLV